MTDGTMSFAVFHFLPLNNCIVTQNHPSEQPPSSPVCCPFSFRVYTNFLIVCVIHQTTNALSTWSNVCPLKLLIVKAKYCIFAGRVVKSTLITSSSHLLLPSDCLLYEQANQSNAVFHNRPFQPILFLIKHQACASKSIS